MFYNNRHIKFLTGVFSLLVVLSCSTEKDALLNVGYHNMTARYNGYYNARVIINEALLTYRGKYQEDYTKIIPLDLYPTAEDAPTLYPNLDDAIERCSKVVVRHSMPNPEAVKNKKNENCRWIDDNWLVIGKAYYIKRDYSEAKEKLKYVSESDFFKSEPAIYDARIWLAKTHIALGEYSDAKRVLITVKNSIDNTAAEKEKKEDKKKKPSKLEKQKAKKSGEKKDKGPAKFPKKLLVDYEVAMAELYIAQKEYKNAIVHLENAVATGKDKKRRARHYFALGQLYADQGNGAEAARCFDKVVHSNAPYEMRFKAKIKNALSAQGNSQDLVKELNKMLKDGKNLEYKDQIYYALGELDVKNNDLVNAKINYSNSVMWSINNDRQKGLSYLKLADMHFAQRDYLSAQKYYDSCVKVIPKEYEDYEMLSNKALGLSGLVFNYETVQFEDSVQRIGQMNPNEREKFLEKTLKDIEAEKERKRIEEERRLLALQAKVNNQQNINGNNDDKKWYFSNPKSVATGFNDFRKLWGQRPLEDNWRRANKESVNASEEDEIGADSLNANKDTLTVDDLLADIPLTQEALDSSNDRILNSLYNLGIIYKEQLKEEKEAVTYFQSVIDRNIEHPKVLPALYQLYLINYKKGDAQAEQYKTAIIKKYPKSEIAQILLDPDYLKKKELKDREELDVYSGTLRNYRRHSYGLVISQCNDIINSNPTNQFINKYYLLKALSLSQVTPGNIESISEPLQALYTLSPQSEEGVQAKAYLDLLKKGEPLTPQNGNNPQSPFVYELDSKYFFILVVPSSNGDVNGTKIKISNFNSEFYRNDGLSLQDAPLGDENQVLVVRTFDDLTKAKIYLSSFKSPAAAAILENTASDFQHFLISTKNFSELLKSKDLASYVDFYKANY